MTLDPFRVVPPRLDDRPHRTILAHQSRDGWSVHLSAGLPMELDWFIERAYPSMTDTSFLCEFLLRGTELLPPEVKFSVQEGTRMIRDASVTGGILNFVLPMGAGFNLAVRIQDPNGDPSSVQPLEKYLEILIDAVYDFNKERDQFMARFRNPNL